MTLKNDEKFSETLTCFKIGIRNLTNFDSNTQKSQKFVESVLSRKCFNLKFTGESCVMTMSSEAKFEEELTSQFKIDMKNLTNFDPSTRKSRKFAL